MKSHLAAAAALALILAACGDDGGTTSLPPAQPTSSTTTAPASTTTQPLVTTTTLPSTTTIASPTSTTTTTPATTTTTPADPPADGPAIVAAGPGGIGLLGEAPLIPPVDAGIGEWVDAIPDGDGGLVYAGAGQDGQTIWWWPAGAGEPVLVSFKPGRSLMDVAVVDGSLAAVVVDNPNPAEDVEPADFVQLIDLADGDTTTIDRQVGGIEWGSAQVSYRDGVFLLTEINHSCGALVVFDRAGADAPLPGRPEPPCLVHFEVPFGGADFGPPGTGFAYVQQHFQDTGEAGGELTGSDLVVVGADGTERARIALGAETFNGVDFDGRWAVVSALFDYEADRAVDPLLVDTQAGSVATLAGGGASSFRIATVPLNVG